MTKKNINFELNNKKYISKSNFSFNVLAFFIIGLFNFYLGSYEKF